MKREISPVFAAVLVVVILVIAGSIYYYTDHAATIRANQAGVNAQSHKGPMPTQTIIPKAGG